MKVLHVGKFYPPVSGGMEKVLQVLCEAEQEHVESSALVANTASATVREEIRGVSVTRVGSLAKVGAVALCPTFPWWMARLTSDVMVLHEPNPVAIVAHALGRPRTPLVLWIHAEVVRPAWRYRLFYRPFLTRLLRRAQRIVVASPPVAEHAAELIAFRDKCSVIPYAVDPDQHQLTAARRVRVAELRATGREPLVLFVGRMVPYKGVDVLLQALVDAPVRAILVGDGPMRHAWESMAHRLGLTGRVTFAGEVDNEELACLYNACDIFALPSVTKAEAFGMVQLEAMACCKPVVSTDLRGSGVSWVNQHGETGLIVPPGDVTSLRAALTTLAEAPERRELLGRNGRTRVIEHFSMQRLVEQAHLLYAGVCAAASGGVAHESSTTRQTASASTLKTP